MLATNVCVTAFGGMIVAAVTTSTRRTAIFAGAAIGLAGLPLVSAAREQDPAAGEFVLWSLGGLVVGGAVTFGLHVLFLESNVDFFRSLGSWLRRSLATQHWADATGSAAPSRRDVVRRWIIAISAAAGSVVGSLTTLALFWEAALAAISPRGLLTLAVLAVVSILLIGPVHERVIAKGLAPEGEGHEADGADAPLVKNLSWQTAGRFALVLLILVIMDLAYSSLEQCMKEGKLLAVYAIFYNFITPAVVSYYWTAAIQLRVRSVAASTTWPTTLLATVLSIAIGLTALYAGSDAILGAGSAQPAQVIGVMLFVLALSVAMALLLGFITTGLFALLGGLTIDQSGGRNFHWILLLTLVIATLPAPIITLAVARLAELDLPIGEYLSYFPPAIGWMLALHLSGFLKLTHDRQTAAATKA